LDFFSKLVAGIQEVASAESLELSVLTIEANAESLDLERSPLGKVSGLLLLGYPSMALTASLRAADVNYVVATGNSNYKDVDSDIVTVNDIEAAMDACRHILSCGRRRIGFLSTRHDYQRLDGFKLELMREGLSIKPKDLRILTSTDISPFIEEMHKWLKEGDLPEAIVVSFCVAAQAVKTILSLNGVQTPEKLMLFTFNHNPDDKGIPCMMLNPALIGRKAAFRMLELLRGSGDSEPHRIVTPMRLELWQGK